MNAKKVYLAIAIVELNNAGYTDSAIAKKLGVHQSTITRKRIDLGLSPISFYLLKTPLALET